MQVSINRNSKRQLRYGQAGSVMDELRTEESWTALRTNYRIEGLIAYCIIMIIPAAGTVTWTKREKQCKLGTRIFIWTRRRTITIHWRGPFHPGRTWGGQRWNDGNGDSGDWVLAETSSSTRNYHVHYTWWKRQEIALTKSKILSLLSIDTIVSSILEWWIQAYIQFISSFSLRVLEK